MGVTAAISLHNRKKLTRVVFLFILLTLLYAAVSNVLLHQLRSPALRYPYVDPAYWLMHLAKVPDIIVSNTRLAYAFDILLFTSCIACILFPLKRIFIILFLAEYFIYFICFNSYGAHHTHALIGVLLVPVPFLFRDKVNFTFVWEALRYYTLFIFASAFLWKLVRLTFLDPFHGQLMLKNNLSAYLLYHPDTFLSRIYFWLIGHPSLIDSFYIAGILLEGVFLVGFFTQKYDRFLFYLSILLILGFWFIADAMFFQLLVLNFTLLDFKRENADSYL